MPRQVKAGAIDKKLVDRYLKLSGVKPKTKQLYGRVLGWVVDACRKNPRDPIDEVVQEWYEKLKVSGASRKTYAVAVNVFLEWCVKHEGFPAGSVPHLRVPRVGAPEKHILTRDMFDRMLECMGDTLVDLRDRAILRLLMSTGIRISGVAAIDLGDMTTRKNSKGRRVTTLRYLGKGHDDKDQTVLVGRKAVDAIERYLKACDPPRDLYKGSGPLFLALRRHHGRMKYEGLYRVVKLRVAKAGLDLRVGPHSFRHMAAIEMWKATKDLRRVQKMLGHSSMVTTEGYLRSLQEDQGEDDEMVIDW